MLLSAALFAASLAACASAHATFQELWIGNTDYGGACVRLPLSNSPVQNVQTNVGKMPSCRPVLIFAEQDIICNASPQSSPNVCTLNAGDTVTAEMHQQPGDRSCASEAIGKTDC